MDSESKVYFDTTLSNLITIKVFHDAGVDVSSFSNFVANYGILECDAFVDGLKALFPDTQCLSAYEEDEEKLIQEIWKVAEFEEESPEYLYVFKNTEMELLINSSFCDELKTLITMCDVNDTEFGDFEFAECRYKFHPVYGGILLVDNGYMLHGVARSIVEIYSGIKELINKLKQEEEKNYGYNRKAV